jgi:hypothetical protein
VRPLLYDFADPLILLKKDLVMVALLLIVSHDIYSVFVRALQLPSLLDATGVWQFVII